MAFQHGKNSQVYFNNFNLTSYFNEFTWAAKAQAADTTIYGQGAKTYISGLLEGTITAKGFFDPSVNAIDANLATQLGTATDAALAQSFTGIWIPGTRIVAAAGVQTDYNVSAPVGNVVTATATFNADNGLKSGISLHDVTTSESVVGVINGQTGNAGAVAGIQDVGSFITGGVITAASNASPIVITSTTTVPTGTVISISGVTGNTAANGTWVVTNLSGTTFSLNGSAGNGAYVSGGIFAQASLGGGMVLLQVPILIGSGAQITSAALQSSISSGGTFSTVVSIPTGTMTGPGYFTVRIPLGTVINAFVRATVTTAGASVTTNYLMAFVRF